MTKYRIRFKRGYYIPAYYIAQYKNWCGWWCDLPYGVTMDRRKSYNIHDTREQAELWIENMGWKDLIDEKVRDSESPYEYVPSWNKRMFDD